MTTILLVVLRGKNKQERWNFSLSGIFCNENPKFFIEISKSNIIVAVSWFKLTAGTCSDICQKSINEVGWDGPY